MSLFERKPRPIPTRDKDPSRLKDDRLFIVACDDTYAPKQYFNFFRFTRVKIHVVETEDGTSVAEHVLKRLLDFKPDENDELWMLLDTDHVTKGTHLAGFMRALQDAYRNGVKVALSKPSFELWLLLHHVEETTIQNLADASTVERALRATLGKYNKTRLKEEHYPRASVAEAFQRARRLDTTVPGGDIPQENTTRVYQLWQAIASKAQASQFPVELRCMLSSPEADSSEKQKTSAR